MLCATGKDITTECNVSHGGADDNNDNANDYEGTSHFERPQLTHI